MKTRLPKQIYFLIAAAIVLAALLRLVERQTPSIEGSRLEANLISGVPSLPNLAGWPPVFIEALKEAHVDLTREGRQVAGLQTLGELYLANGFHVQARQCFAALSSINPGQARWPYFRSIAMQDFSNKEDRADALREASRREDSYSNIRYALGLALLDLGQWDEARVQFEALSKREGWAAWASFGEAQIMLGQDRVEEGLFWLERAIESDPGVKDFYALQAEVASMANPAAARLARLRERRLLEDRRPYDAWFQSLWPRCFDSLRLVRFARAEAAKGSRQVALTILERAVLFDSANTEALSFSGSLLLEEGETERAAASFRQSLAVDDSGDQAWLGLAESLFRKNEPERGMAVLREGSEVVLQPSRLLSRLGDHLQESGQLMEARVAYRKALDSDAENEAALKALGLILLEKGDSEGVALLERYLKIEVDDVVAYSLLSDFLRSRGDIEKSHSLIWKGLLFVPDSELLQERL